MTNPLVFRVENNLFNERSEKSMEREYLVSVMQHNLLHIRKTLHMSAKDFGSLIGVTRQTINNMEARRNKLTVTQYLAILYVLEHDIIPNLDDGTVECIRLLLSVEVQDTDYTKSLIFEKEGKS